MRQHQPIAIGPFRLMQKSAYRRLGRKVSEISYRSCPRHWNIHHFVPSCLCGELLLAFTDISQAFAYFQLT